MKLTFPSFADGSQLCAEADPDTWFPTQGNNGGVAKAICGSCSLVEECREWGINNERFGIWGGLGAPQLHAARKARGITLDTGSAAPVRDAACGTIDGVRLHQRHGDPLCDDCTLALREDLHSRYGEAAS